MNDINNMTKNILKSAILQPSYTGLNLAKIPYIHCNLSHICPPTKMASETMKRSTFQVSIRDNCSSCPDKYEDHFKLLSKNTFLSFKRVGCVNWNSGNSGP